MKYDITINRPYEPVSCYTQRQADEVAEELRKVGIRVLTLQNAWRRKYACSFHSLKESNELYFEPKAMDVFCFLCELKDVNFQTIFGSGFQCIKYAAVSELNTNYRYKILIIKVLSTRAVCSTYPLRAAQRLGHRRLCHYLTTFRIDILHMYLLRNALTLRNLGR